MDGVAAGVGGEDARAQDGGGEGAGEEEHGHGGDDVHAGRVAAHVVGDFHIVGCVLLRYEVEDQVRGDVFALFVVEEPHLLLFH